jgi:hypothetical protein
VPLQFAFMTLKFGSLPAQVVSQVPITDTQKLQQLADALTRAPDLESFLIHSAIVPVS